jgi:hypothetical protein
MRLSSSVALALVAALVSAGPALAWTYVEDEAVAGTFQEDATGEYGLSLACDLASGIFAITIDTSDEWTKDEDYLDEVDIGFSVDGTVIDTVPFAVTDLGGYVGLMLTDLDDGFELVHEALIYADGTITARFLDIELSFEGAGAAAAFDDVEIACWS